MSRQASARLCTAYGMLGLALVLLAAEWVWVDEGANCLVMPVSGAALLP